MSKAIIEINDFEIRVSKNHEIVVTSPGFAHTTGDKILVGEEALKQARLHPRSSHNRYWKNLNQDPLQNPTPLARHHADLAFAHLLQLHEQSGKPDEVILAVPGVYSNEQLALLLGLIDASPLSAAGIVDSAVAAAAPVVGPGRYTHVDLQLHQAVLTNLEVGNDVVRGNVSMVDGAGMLALLDNTAHLIADLFIKESRFDPQHHPDTEQALYDQIPACLNSLRVHKEVVLEIQYQQTLHQARLTADSLQTTLLPLYERIVNSMEAESTPLLSQSSGNLPGIGEVIKNAEVLSNLNISQACIAHEDVFSAAGSGLSYVTRLGAAEEALVTAVNTGQVNTEVPTEAAPSSAAVAASKHDITHVLLGHRAYPLGTDTVFLSAAGKLSSHHANDAHCEVSASTDKITLNACGDLSVYLNGSPVSEPVQVNAGDIVSFTGSKTEYMFIHVS